jgi:hypothetical protein
VGIALAIALSAYARESAAGIHYGILTQLSNAPKQSAFVEVVADPTVAPGAAVAVTVFRVLGPATINLTTDANGFAASPNLLQANDPDLLVQVFSAAPIAVNIRQEASGAKTFISLPPQEKSLGVSWTLAQGAGTAYLLVGNTGSAPSSAAYRAGTAPGAAVFVDAQSVVRIPLPSLAEYVSLTTQSNAVVQLAIDTGKVDQTLITPN